MQKHQRQRHHAAQVVVNRTSKNASKHYPQVACGTKPCAHYGAKDRTRAGNVQELNHKHFPRGHGNVVHTVGMSNSGSLSAVGAKDAFYHSTIYQVAQYQGSNAYKK